MSWYYTIIQGKVKLYKMANYMKEMTVLRFSPCILLTKKTLSLFTQGRRANGKEGQNMPSTLFLRSGKTKAKENSEQKFHFTELRKGPKY